MMIMLMIVLMLVIMIKVLMLLIMIMAVKIMVMMMMTMMMLIMMHCDMPATEGPPRPLLPLSCPVRLLAISEKPENFALTSTSTVFFLVQ